MSVSFYACMAGLGLWGAWFLPPESPAKSPTVEPPPIVIVIGTFVVGGLSVTYYSMKAKAADKSAWRLFWFGSWVLMLTIGLCPELFSLRLPSPLWKVALIPSLALAFSTFNVAVSGAFGGAKKS
jgi:hypothetical protein